MKNIKEEFPEISSKNSYHWIVYGPDNAPIEPMICCMSRNKDKIYIQMFGDSKKYEFIEHPTIKNIKRMGYNIYLSDRIIFKKQENLRDK